MAIDTSIDVPGTSIYSLDQYVVGGCFLSEVAAAEGGPDVVYALNVQAGNLTITNHDPQFEGMMYLTKTTCEDAANGGLDTTNFQGCDASILEVGFQLGGTYYLVLDGKGEKTWGDYNITVSLD